MQEIVVETLFMSKMWYNNHDIEVNLESRDDMVCVPPTRTGTLRKDHNLAWAIHTF